MGTAVLDQETISNLAILQEACDRNVPLQLHYVNPNLSKERTEPDVLVAYTRLLKVDKEKIYLDCPQHIGKQVRLCSGRRVDGYFTMQGVIFKFQTLVTDLNILIELNKHKKIVGMCLATPHLITEGQRREDHRISVSAREAIPVAVHEGINDTPGQTLLDAKRFRATIVNLSRGGVALKFEDENRFLLKYGQWYYLAFRLPDEKDELLFMAELRHITEILEGEARRVGFQFLNWPDALEMRSKLAILNRFLANTERSQLQKMRSKKL